MNKIESNDDNNFSKNPMDFYEYPKIIASNNKKPFTVYYDNPDNSVRLLKGDCIEILNKGRENSVDMIFADPPYFLSNGAFIEILLLPH